MSKKVFISYAKPDVSSARKLAMYLRSNGLVVWFDEHSLSPGNLWQDEILKAIHESDFFIALLSNNSVMKRGYIQKEMAHALSVFEMVPHGKIYFIPARLDNCEVPFHLQKFHFVDLFPNWQTGVNKLVSTLGITPIDELQQDIVKELEQILRMAESGSNIRDASIKFQRWRIRATDFIKNKKDEANALRFSLVSAPNFITGPQPRLIYEAMQCNKLFNAIVK